MPSKKLRISQFGNKYSVLFSKRLILSAKKSATALQAEIRCGVLGGVKKQRSAVGTALCGAFVLDTNTPHPAEMHRSGFWVPFATKRYKRIKEW